MLYATTRNENDAFTAYRTLAEGRGPDNGLYVPLKLPKPTQESLTTLKEKSFGQNLADILNLFFGARLDGLDVDFCIGRYPTKMVSMSHRILVAETWHNPDYDFSRMVHNLSSRIRGNQDTETPPTNWAWITVRIATLFALFGELQRVNLVNLNHPIDIALPSGDFAGPMAVWYAREMGLPIGNIICSCDDGDGSWDLLHQGTLQPSSMIPSDLERLIYETLGREEAIRYVERLEKGRIYSLSETKLKELNKGISVAVISTKRRENIIRSVYQTSTYILDPGSAMAYGGLQDYRSSAGEVRPALILTERGPICSAHTVAEALRISEDELKARLNFT